MATPSSTEASSNVALPQRRYSILGGVLSYLIPGLGQIVQGRWTKGVFFMATLLTMFFAGQAMGEWRNVYLPAVAKGPEENFANNPWKWTGPLKPFANILHHRWQFAGQFWIGVPAWPALWQYMDMPVPAEETSPFWHNFQRGPRDFFREEPQWEFIRAHDKTIDVAWVYTVVAGVLNILVIYDAFAGPAHAATTIEPRKEALPALGEKPAS
jgi:hypothetical protein